MSGSGTPQNGQESLSPRREGQKADERFTEALRRLTLREFAFWGFSGEWSGSALELVTADAETVAWSQHGNGQPVRPEKFACHIHDIVAGNAVNPGCYLVQ